MDKTQLLELITFFNRLHVEETDVTLPDEKQNGQLVVTVNYKYAGNNYTTKKLYYRNIRNVDDIKYKASLLQYFDEPIFWLDLDKHNWPQGSGESDLDNIVINDIASSDDPNFKNFLLKLANNTQTGSIQLITEEGRTGQYYHNLENNNHWHDLIKLIQALINSGGNEINKNYFSRLVFRWDGDKNTERERSTLTDKAYPCSRRLIEKLQLNIKFLQPEILKMEIIELLKYKYQIILQGPPGSGKTRLAKQLATELTKLPLITEEYIRSIIKPGLKLNSATGYTYYVVKEIGGSNITIELPNETKSQYKPSFKEIIKAYEINMWDGKQQAGNDPYSAAIAKFIYEKQDSDQVKLIQFHPAYSYEDFVRGISAKPLGNQIEYATENRVLGDFANKALKNFQDSKKEPSELTKEKWAREIFENYKDFVLDEIDKNDSFVLNDTVTIIAVEDDAFRYTGQKWQYEHRMKYEDLIQLYLHEIKERRDIKKQEYISALGRTHATYFKIALDKFRDFINGKTFDNKNASKGLLKTFVLIIDEINRANLPSVLGELIYGLEYRGESVESMYAIDNDRKIILPPNLYIIGTMNTADRSVGHIDYAIRRRFAFVDVLPSENVIDEMIQDQNLRAKSKELYKRVSALFEQSNLASEFQSKDVQLGHSYFLAESESQLRLKLEHEIKPILREYLKDGILLNSAKVKIEDLNV